MPSSNITPTLAQMARLQTKKIWEKVIGAKYNVNDEVNLIAQHWANINQGMSIVSKVTGGKTGKR